MKLVIYDKSKKVWHFLPQILFRPRTTRKNNLMEHLKTYHFFPLHFIKFLSFFYPYTIPSLLSSRKLTINNLMKVNLALSGSDEIE